MWRRENVRNWFHVESGTLVHLDVCGSWIIFPKERRLRAPLTELRPVSRADAMTTVTMIFGGCMPRTVRFRNMTWKWVDLAGGCDGYERVDADGTYWLLQADDPDEANVPVPGQGARLSSWPREQAFYDAEDAVTEEIIPQWYPDHTGPDNDARILSLISFVAANPVSEQEEQDGFRFDAERKCYVPVPEMVPAFPDGHLIPNRVGTNLDELQRKIRETSGPSLGDIVRDLYKKAGLDPDNPEHVAAVRAAAIASKELSAGTICPDCGGAGEIEAERDVQVQDVGPVAMLRMWTCETCAGEGTI